ncbi:MAG: glycosyltransferase [Paracoccus sp. (in: a-proteobacteria)]|nr:glycosyltransferase [Paracoccus sp. (in: a-proteobacteria)]
MTVAIPKIMSHIWIGPRPAPLEWMQSWRDKHPDWEYRLYDNDFLMRFPFRTRRLINEYFWRGEYAGVQDLMRYEILYAFGGFMADADAICLHPVDELMTRKGVYAVYDRAGEEGRGVSPFLASDAGNPLLKETIDILASLDPWELRKPFHSTGNLFLMRLIQKWGADKLTIFPSHYFVPWHHSDPENRYDGPDKIYAEQKWATATFSYNTRDVAGEDRVLSRDAMRDRSTALRKRLLQIVQPDLGGVPLAPVAPDPAKKQADRAANRWNEIQQHPDWEGGLRDLNNTVLGSLDAGGLPAIINGGGFYRLRQAQRVSDSDFMSSTRRLRKRITAYLAAARAPLQIGVDAGHMLYAQLMASPEAEAVAFDTCTRILPRSAPVEVYTPAAMAWLTKSFAGRVTFLHGRPGHVLNAYRRRHPDHRFDLLHFNGIDDNFLKAYGAAIEMLGDGGLILLQDMAHDRVLDRLFELQMIGEVATPIELHDFGPRRGALAVLRRRPAGDRARSFHINNSHNGFE